MTQPGDVRPSRLERPPGDRYRTAAPSPVLERPLMARAIAWGILATLLVALVGALLRGILDLSGGAIAVAVGGGWAIGAGVRLGAWGGQLHRASSAPTLAAVTLGALCWLGSLMGAWVVAMAILPGSSRGFLDRLVATPFLDWMSPQLGLADVVSLLLFVVFAGIGARSASTRADPTS